MSGLAELALEYLTLILFDRSNVDADFAFAASSSVSDYFADMTDQERASLSETAANQLAFLRSGPDEAGHDPGANANPDLIQFLEAVASGEIYEQCSDSSP